MWSGKALLHRETAKFLIFKQNGSATILFGGGALFLRLIYNLCDTYCLSTYCVQNV